MAYGKRYQSQSFAKSNKMFTAEIYEKDYSGPFDNIPAGLMPFEQNVLASSDDPFEPLLASELRTNLDITDFTGTIPDLTTRDDKKYHVKLKAGAAPNANESIIMWKNYESTIPENLDCNFQIYVNGQSVLFEFFNNTGELQVNATDTVRLECAVFSTPSGLPIVGAGWRLIVKEDGVTVFDTTDQNPAAISAINYTFVAGYQKVYTVLCYSYQIGDDSTTIPVNTIYDIFQGYLLTDDTSLSFSSGRKFLDLSFVDGLGMLRSVPYLTNYTNTVDINSEQSLLQIILQCLNKLELPDGFGLNIACNIYAEGMDDTLSSFEQMYYPVRNWMNSDYTFMDCHTVLTTICKSFGAQIFQANGEYWIVNIEERAAGTLRYFKYLQDGSFVSLNNNDPSRTIAPYTPSVDHYFINGDQAKIIRKGFAEIDIKCAANYPPQIIDNGAFRNVTAGLPDNWTVTLGTFGTIDPITYNQVPGFEIFAGSTQSTMQPNSIGKIHATDIINISFALKSIPVTNLPGIEVEIKLDNGTDFWKWDDDQWKFNHPNAWYEVPSTTNALQNISITTLPAPASGTLTIIFRVLIGSTPTTAFIGNVFCSLSSMYDYRLIKNPDTETQYKRDVEVVMGGQSDYNNTTQLGALLDASGAFYTNWFRYGITEQFETLTRLILQQYINIQSAAQINMQGNVSSIFSANGPISLITKFDVQDTTTLLPVTGLAFVPGSMRINFTDDVWSGTFLQISDTEITETITDVITLKKS